MPCDDCNKNKSGVIVRDNWKDGANNTVQGGGVKPGMNNKALRKSPSNLISANKFTPYNSNREASCKSCKKKLMSGNKYCAECANRKGRCSMCGKKTFDIRGAGAVIADYKK